MRFASCEHCERIMATQLPLHICEANASLTKLLDCDILYSKKADFMATDKLSELSMELSVEIINLVKRLKEHRQSKKLLSI